MTREEKKISSPIGEITIVTLTNDAGASVSLSSLGAGIVEVRVPDRDGNLDNIALNYADPSSYLADGPCMGKVPGRYANRIARGKFHIGDNEYSLAVNNGPNALHGGPEGFQNRIWDVKELPNGVRFVYNSADGEEGYPGNLKVTADYLWNDNNILELHLMAETDKDTVINLTNHAYWNLRGAQSGPVLDQTLRLKASRYLPTDETLIPTGEVAPVDGTPMDFREAKPLGRDIKAPFPAIEYGKGYDSCWVTDGWRKGCFIQGVARLADEKTGRVLEVGSTMPGVQIYTGNWLSGSPESPSGRGYEDYDGVAIEMQYFPDSPNQSSFPSTLLRKGERFDERIRFEFKTL